MINLYFLAIIGFPILVTILDYVLQNGWCQIGKFIIYRPTWSRSVKRMHLRVEAFPKLMWDSNEKHIYRIKVRISINKSLLKLRRRNLMLRRTKREEIKLRRQSHIINPDVAIKYGFILKGKTPLILAALEYFLFLYLNSGIFILGRWFTKLPKQPVKNLQHKWEVDPAQINRAAIVQDIRRDLALLRSMSVKFPLEY